jgi:membrane-bound serine protease (ClpP class)
LLAQGIVNSLDEVLEKAGLAGAKVVRVEATGFERLALWITALAPFLLLGGIIGGYIEFKMPGFGFFGILSIICFTLFFTGHFVAGLAGWEVVICFAIGLVLVLGELIIHPGTVLPGIAGILLMLAALIYAMVDRWPSQPVWPTQEMLLRPLINVCLALIAAAFLAYLLAKYLPRTSLYHSLVLSEAVPSGHVVNTPTAALIVGAGASGVAKTTLRPSGTAEFGEQLLDVVSQGEFIPEGSAVRVVLVEGPRVVVEPA